MNKLEVKKIRKSLKKNQKEFAEMLGVGERAVQTWESGDRNISQSAALLLKMILEKNEQSDELKSKSSVQSLNTPKTNEKKLGHQEIPLYDIEVTAGVVTLFKTPKNTKPIDTIKIPNMPKCDGAITVTGDSMYPLIKSGDIVFYKIITDLPQSIFFGNMYIVSMDIEGDELVMVKYIQKGKDDNHLLLVSENKHHADKEIHIKYINGLALVKGNVRFNFTT